MRIKGKLVLGADTLPPVVTYLQVWGAGCDAAGGAVGGVPRGRHAHQAGGSGGGLGGGSQDLHRHVCVGGGGGGGCTIMHAWEQC